MVEDNVLENMAFDNEPKFLYILRGIYGIGKTSFAECLGGIIHSTDKYFENDKGEYIWVRSLSKLNHINNQEAVRGSMIDGLSSIIVDNTNIRLWEMQPYIKLARVYNYKIRIVEFTIPYGLTPKILAKRTKHPLTVGYIKDKINEFEPFTYLEDVLKSEKPKGK